MAILLKNLKIITQNDRRDIVSGDILIEGTVIKKVGKITEKVDKIIDCRSKLAIPGLINTHTHAAMTLLRGYADDMELNKWLTTKIWPAESKLTADDIYKGSLLGAVEMVKSGTTCFADMYFHMESVARAANTIGLRANLSHGMIDMANKEKMARELKTTEEFIKNYHNYVDGLISCSLGPHSIYTCSEDLLLKAVELSNKYDLRMQIHLSETRKEVFDCLKSSGKRPVELLDKMGFFSPNVLASHCVWLTKQEIKTLAKNDVKVSHNPTSNMKLASGGVTPIKEMLESNLVVSLGTDGASSNNSLSLLEAMKLTSLLQKAHRWDATVISAQQALDFATRNGALALGVNAGSIEPGKLADIVLFDLNAPNMTPQHNLVSNIVYSSQPGNVTDVIINGRLIMQNREILTVDEQKVIQEAQKAAERIAQ